MTVSVAAAASSGPIDFRIRKGMAIALHTAGQLVSPLLPEKDSWEGKLFTRTISMRPQPYGASVLEQLSFTEGAVYVHEKGKDKDSGEDS